MRTFRVALTGDFLDETGASAYGDISLGLLDACPHLQYHFLKEQAPRPGDHEYWQRFYALEMKAEQIDGINGLVVLRPRAKAAMFARGADDLVVIGRSGAGYDKVDLAACTANDVALFNAPMALNHSTASTALLFMLALAKRLPEQERITREGRWDRQAQVMGGELQQRTLGIIGLGHSGRELVRLVAPFAMRVLAYSPHADPKLAASLDVELTALDEVLRQADFLSLHCRLSEQSTNLLGKPQLSLMKASAYLINVARGELIDETALVEVLRDRRIAGAGLDVFAVEPLPLDNPLLKLDNVILTPHWLASSSDVFRATGKAMATGMLRAASSQVPENVVNVEVLERRGFRDKLARFAENASSQDAGL